MNNKAWIEKCASDCTINELEQWYKFNWENFVGELNHVTFNEYDIHFYIDEAEKSVSVSVHKDRIIKWKV